MLNGGHIELFSDNDIFNGFWRNIPHVIIIVKMLEFEWFCVVTNKGKKGCVCICVKV